MIVWVKIDRYFVTYKGRLDWDSIILFFQTKLHVFFCRQAESVKMITGIEGVGEIGVLSHGLIGDVHITEYTCKWCY